MKLFSFYILVFFIFFSNIFAQEKKGFSGSEKNEDPTSFTIARLKYGGGGDWYWGRSAIPNMLDFLKKNTNLLIDTDIPVGEEVWVSIMDKELFEYPFLFITGHGNIFFSDQEIKRLKNYLTHGGFLFVNDSYGLDKAFRREIKKVFPDKDLIELPSTHGIYHCFYDFPKGLPKIHQHDGKSPQGFGIFYEGRLVVFYVYESDISDGWEDPEVHHDPPEKREMALKMGVNIITWVLGY